MDSAIKPSVGISRSNVMSRDRKDKRLFVLENDGKGRFTQHVIDHGKESHLGTLLFDLDGDGDLDNLSIAWDEYRFLHLWRNNALKRMRGGSR